jgi:hypothetical protein
VEEARFACSIDRAQLVKRADQVRLLIPRVRTRGRERSTVTLDFGVEAAPDVRRFVADESRCCPFLSFDINRMDREVRLAISAPPGGEALLDALDAAFAGDGSKLRAVVEGAA